MKRWCPTVGKVKNKGFHDYMTCFESTETCYTLPEVSRECPSPLWRQKLTLGNVHAPLYSLPTELTGKPVAGLHVRAFQLLGRQNQAEIEIVTQEHGVGVIIVQNMTFSPGIFNDVTTVTTFTLDQVPKYLLLVKCY